MTSIIVIPPGSIVVKKRLRHGSRRRTVIYDAVGWGVETFFRTLHAASASHKRDRHAWVIGASPAERNTRRQAT